MDRETIFVYLIRNGKVVKDECVCARDEKYKHRMTIYCKGRNRQSILESQLDFCERNRVVSFEDNLPKFTQMLVEDLEKRVKDAEKRLMQQKQVLDSIKKNSL
jgi:hypothetical protein